MFPPRDGSLQTLTRSWGDITRPGTDFVVETKATVHKRVPLGITTRLTSGLSLRPFPDIALSVSLRFFG